MEEKAKIITVKPPKRIVLPAVVLGTSIYYSATFTGGIIIGYIISKLFYEHLVETGKIDSIFIDFGSWTFHLHHWIMGAAVLAIAWISKDVHLSALVAGFICGVIVHDIYDFNDWHKVVLRNEEYAGA